MKLKTDDMQWNGIQYVHYMVPSSTFGFLRALRAQQDV